MKQDENISKLPEEILQNIFKYLDRDSLMKAVLVCRQWNEVVIIDVILNHNDDNEDNAETYSKCNLKVGTSSHLWRRVELRTNVANYSPPPHHHHHRHHLHHDQRHRFVIAEYDAKSPFPP